MIPARPSHGTRGGDGDPPTARSTAALTHAFRERRYRAVTLEKIISGGQTGVDRGALDAALASGFPCGGWCPEGRKAEDGRIPDRYPVAELSGADYLVRTRQNVIDADGTLVLHFTELAGGTLNTVRLCERFKKPVLVLDGDGLDPDAAAGKAAAFVRSQAIRTLNVAGPRESGHVGAQAYAEQVVACLLQNMR